MEEETRAYIAGIFDGEGSILLKSTGAGPGSQGQIELSNTNEELIDWLIEQLGGSKYLPPYKSNQRPVWRWCIQDRTGISRVIECIKPYTRLKKDHITLMEYWLTIGSGRGNPLTDEVRLERAVLKVKFTDLNKRGVK